MSIVFKIKIVLFVLSALCIISSCGNEANDITIIRDLPDAEYPIDIIGTGVVQLKDGVFEESVAPDSATKTRITLGNELASGDLNGDDIEDVTVVLIADPGGSGTFYYLAAVINKDGQANPIASTLLGDRIIVKDISIEDGVISVSLLIRKSNEPMSAEPKIETIQKFKLQGNLIEKI